MKILQLKAGTVSCSTVFLSLCMTNSVFAEPGQPQNQLPAIQQQEQAYRQQQQAFAREDREQYRQAFEEQRQFIQQKEAAERIQLKDMAEQQQRYLQTIEQQPVVDNRAAGGERYPQASQTDMEQQLEDYDNKLQLQSPY